MPSPFPIEPRPLVDKVDLLFMVDNSMSMREKQELLAQAMEDLLARLLLPNCVLKDNPTQTVPRQMGGTCPPTAREEFKPVHDLHIGIVTSSMGGGGSPDICLSDRICSQGGAPLFFVPTRHNDDKAHLINRTNGNDACQSMPVDIPVQDALPSNFLAWLPDRPENRDKMPPWPLLKDPLTGVPPTNTLIQDFQQMVRGVGEFGCGLESQMESWYQFLVQPDPYDSIELDMSQTPAAATLVGIDQTILQQRHDFLRPDSLLAVIVLTDEEDSWTDPMWLGGRGWITRAINNPFSATGQLPRGTSACDAPLVPGNEANTGPNDPNCQWCGSKGTETDPNCANKGIYSNKDDGLNVRYTNDMKRKYGINPQFPVQRYIDGLKSALVPNQQGEHFTTNGNLSPSYIGRKTCRNPIYADSLPTDPSGELCKLKPGSRTSDLVFFAIIGGVPWQLLTDAADKTSDTRSPLWKDASFKTELNEADWMRILGKDPSLYDSTGQDIHMQEAVHPRITPCGPSAPNDCDGFNGREWDTLTSKIGIDLQYACIFPLPRAKDCTKSPDSATCDCGQNYAGPLCDPNPTDGNNPTLQTRGKAYPAIRELRVARAMGPNGIASSICVRSLDTNDANYGYRAAVRAIVDRIAPFLSTDNCLPQPLWRLPNGTVACHELVLLPGFAADQPYACWKDGLVQPDPLFLKRFNNARLVQLEQGGHYPTAADLSPVCELVQRIPDPGSCPMCTFGGHPTCEDDGAPGWCYVEGVAAAQCPLGGAQAIRFGVPPPAATTQICEGFY